MPGLVPGIHAAVQSTTFACFFDRVSNPPVENLQAVLRLPGVDGRDKPGHDGERAALRLTE